MAEGKEDKPKKKKTVAKKKPETKKKTGAKKSEAKPTETKASTQTTPTAAETKTATKTPAKSNKNKPMPKFLKVILAIFAGIVGFVVVMGVIFYMASSGATKASDEFLNAMQAGDGTTAYSLFSAEAKEIVPEDEFIAAVDQAGPILDTEERKVSTNVSAESDSDTEALVVYEIDGTDGVTYIFAVNMVKEDGDWKVLRFDSDVKDEE